MQATLTLIETFGRCGLNVVRLSVSKMNVPPGLMA
jgi:hypothetical protein